MTMVTFPLIIAAILAVVGLILLIGSVAVLFWTLWKGWVVEPSRRAAGSAAVEEQARTASGE